MNGSLFYGRQKQKGREPLRVRGLFGEIDSLLLDQHTSGPDTRTRSHMHSGRRRMIAMGAECTG
ncbi:hypothetical protein [Thiobacillus sp.]|uniref:hypothetical protein n=1 Tax=Thiobacillus sp. TaxID=924 RepID=UPI0025E174F9|nr:hypothetical protein [Thiobacillus sp.]MBT9541078.1 hypothetical protein [Thiobacillus sp.]